MIGSPDEGAKVVPNEVRSFRDLFTGSLLRQRRSFSVAFEVDVVLLSVSVPQRRQTRRAHSFHGATLGSARKGTRCASQVPLLAGLNQYSIRFKFSLKRPFVIRALSI